MNAYIYTTDAANMCLVAVGEDENEAKAVAEQAVSIRPNVKLQGFQPINHSVVFTWDVTILTKANSDDVLIRKVVAHFGKEVPIELRNEPRPDGTVMKRFYVDGVGRFDLKLNNPQAVAEYEKNGLDDSFVQDLIGKLSPYVKRGGRPELTPVLLPAEDKKENPNGNVVP